MHVSMETAITVGMPSTKQIGLRPCFFYGSSWKVTPSVRRRNSAKPGRSGKEAGARAQDLLTMCVAPAGQFCLG